MPSRMIENLIVIRAQPQRCAGLVRKDALPAPAAARPHQERQVDGGTRFQCLGGPLHDRQRTGGHGFSVEAAPEPSMNTAAACNRSIVGLIGVVLRPPVERAGP